MNAFEEKRAARVERMRARSERRAGEAAQAFGRAQAIGSMIPMGQPILVGHHSERRHRRDVARIDSAMRKGVEAHRESEQIGRRADAAEANTAVSSDDPEAVSKLRGKLAEAEALRARWKVINAATRKGPAALTALALTAEELRTLRFAPCGTGFMVTNASGNIRRLAARLAEIEAKAAAPAPAAETVGDVVIDEVDNRVRLAFPGKPSEAVRRELKAHGFRWSPTAETWQRHSSVQAWHHARRIAAL